MANLAITTVNPIEIFEQLPPAPAGETFSEGDFVRINTSGKAVLGNASSLAEGRRGGLTLKTVTAVNETVTVVTKAYLDVGEALASLTIGDTIYLSDTDGQLATTAGTVVRAVGNVHGVFSGTATADKVLYVDFTQLTQGY